MNKTIASEPVHIIEAHLATDVPPPEVIDIVADMTLETSSAANDDFEELRLEAAQQPRTAPSSNSSPGI